MPRILEAEAVIRARDATGGVFERVADRIKAMTAASRAVSGTSSVLANVGSKIDEIGDKAAATGRKMATGITLPTALAARSLYQNIHEFELASNKLKAFGNLNEDELKRARRLASEIGTDYAFGPVGVIKGMVEQIKAGFEPRHLQAIQKPLLDFATLAEIDVPQASELAIFALAGFGKMYDKTGKMLGDAALNKNLRELVDLFAILNKVAPGNIRQISETFKYSSAAASQLNISPEQLGAFTAVLNQAGILGPEAGVALRSMMVRFLKPTKGALQALSTTGMRLSDYVQVNPDRLKHENVLSAVETLTGTLSKEQRAFFQKGYAGLNNLDGDDFRKGLIDLVTETGTGRLGKKVGNKTLTDADVAGDLVSRIIGSAVEKIDVMSFLKDASAKAPNFAAFMAQFMDQRQAVRLANLDSARVTHMLTEMEKELAAARERGTSASREMAALINSGVIEQENRLRGAYQNLIVAAGDSGVTDAAAKTFEALSGGLRAIADVNPDILKFSTYAVAIAAAAGPVMWVFGKLAGLVGLIAKLGGAALPAAANPIGAGVLLGAGAIGTLHDATKEYAGQSIKERLEKQRGGSVNDALRRAYNEERERLGIPTIAEPPKAELSGSADISTTIKVEPTPDFWTRIEQKINNAINGLRINGAPPTGTAGSTGTSMPEAGPMP